MQLKKADATMTLKYPTLSPMCPGIIRPKSEAALPSDQLCLRTDNNNIDKTYLTIAIR